MTRPVPEQALYERLDGLLATLRVLLDDIRDVIVDEPGVK